jgi:hypothetical protein
VGELFGGEAFARGIGDDDIGGQSDKLFAHALSFRFLIWIVVVLSTEGNFKKTIFY